MVGKLGQAARGYSIRGGRRAVVAAGIMRDAAAGAARETLRGVGLRNPQCLDATTHAQLTREQAPVRHKKTKNML